jgi:hypothetical protein
MSANKKTLSILSFSLALLSACNSGFTGGQASTDTTSSSSSNIATLDTTDKKLVKAELGGASSSTKTVSNWDIPSSANDVYNFETPSNDYNNFSSCNDIVNISYRGRIDSYERAIDMGEYVREYNLKEGTMVRLKGTGGYLYSGIINNRGLAIKTLEDNLPGGCGCWDAFYSKCAKFFNRDGRGGSKVNSLIDRNPTIVIELYQKRPKTEGEIIIEIEKNLGFSIGSILDREEDDEIIRVSQYFIISCRESSDVVTRKDGVFDYDLLAVYELIQERLDPYNPYQREMAIDLTSSDSRKIYEKLSKVVRYLLSEQDFLDYYQQYLINQKKGLTDNERILTIYKRIRQITFYKMLNKRQYERLLDLRADLRTKMGETQSIINTVFPGIEPLEKCGDNKNPLLGS